MFCNLKTDRLGPKHLPNKAATRVKRTIVVVGSPEQIRIEDSDEVDVPKGTEKVPHQQKNRATNCHKHHVAGAAMSEQSKKKQPLVIELSSDSISSATSDYKLKDDIEMKEEDQDSHISSVESEYEQASSSHKRKPKTMYPSRKTKKVAADESRKEPPCIKSSKGKLSSLGLLR